MYGVVSYDYRKLYEDNNKKSEDEKGREKVNFYCLFYGICDAFGGAHYYHPHYHYPHYGAHYDAWPGYYGYGSAYGYSPYYYYGK